MGLIERVSAERLALFLPFGLLAAFFTLPPLLISFWLSFHEAKVSGSDRFIGLSHWVALGGSDLFWKVVGTTVIYSAGVCALSMCCGLLLAWALGGLPSGLGRFLQILAVLPALFSPVALSVLFLLLFHGDEGLLNAILTRPWGVEAIDWLKDPDWILSALVLQGGWRWAGMVAFIVCSAVATLPSSRLEAAYLDGANYWQAYWRVSVPSIRPVLGSCMLFLVLDGVVQAAGSYVLFGASGSTNDEGLMLVGLAYRSAFVLGDFGLAAAVSLLGVGALIPGVLLSRWLIGKGDGWA